jgi:MOSC domain-containing protein YiiM|tara:strand:- start:382 stop:879 length:498 start_codon:yes stop_codon:yes gene_type:complete
LGVKEKMNVELLHLFVSPGHDFKGRHGMEALSHGVVDEEGIECVAGSGIQGDRYFDFKEDFKGQITFFDASVYEAVKENFELPDLGAEAFRRNVIVKGVDLNSLIGKKFRIGEVEFEGSEEAAPCHWMDDACADGVHEFLKGNGGLRARIRVGGTLKKGAGELEV